MCDSSLSLKAAEDFTRLRVRLQRETAVKRLPSVLLETQALFPALPPPRHISHSTRQPGECWAIPTGAEWVGKSRERQSHGEQLLLEQVLALFCPASAFMPLPVKWLQQQQSTDDEKFYALKLWKKIVFKVMVTFPFSMWMKTGREETQQSQNVKLHNSQFRQLD
ncbi:hypothetical protein Q7C36_021354 [Tachysurus vachellii]|uniref:Uncharacterized protein n=1 Tax=Tachysurus vachellii TaxID=175792 RepID=A0AA88LJM9_TACVA|nr:hypothetical protein Q7C36_021354 [Tachysurus vachellii]